MLPASIPAVAFGPKMNPAIIGVPITRNPGAIIFLSDSLVEISIHP